MREQTANCNSFQPLPSRFALFLKISAIVLIVLALAYRGYLLRVRYFDPDEFEHLQAAFLISKGLIPYQDFCENHLPLHYYLLSPLFFLGTNVKLLLGARCFSLILVVLIFFLLYKLIKRVYSPTIGLVALLWLSFNFMFLWRTLEIRPLLPALVFLLLGILLLSSSSKNSKNIYWGLAGFFWGLSFLCTQKVIFLLGGLAGFFIYEILTTPNNYKSLLLNSCWMAAGFFLPLLLTGCYFLSQGAFLSFFHQNFICAVRWKYPQKPIHLDNLLYHNPFFCFFGTAGFLATTWALLRRNITSRAVSLIYFITLSALGLGIFLNPAVSPQYLALVIPLIAIYASRALLTYVTWLNKMSLKRRLIGGLVIIISGLAIPLSLKYFAHYQFILPWNNSLENPNSSLTITAIFLILSYGLFLLSSFTARRAALLLMAGAILFRPVVYLINYPKSDNRGQIGDLKLVHRLTGPEEKVMDGWTGLGLMRLPAYYYHYLPWSLLPLLTEEEKGPRLLAALKKDPPKIIISGKYLQDLSPEVRNFINSNYQPFRPGRAFLVRKSSSD